MVSRQPPRPGGHKKWGTGLLTRREMETFGWLARGLKRREIADRMHITLRGANHHIAGVFTKMGVRNRVEFHRKAGFLEEDSDGKTKRHDGRTGLLAAE